MRSYRIVRPGKVWLDANESPWNDTQYNRYPDPHPYKLVSHLSSIYAISTDEILVTRGIDEGIDLLVRLFCCAGKDNIMICPPTYGMYNIAASIQNAGVVKVPLQKTNDFSLDLSEIRKKWQLNIKLIFLCSPNNPTGNLLDVPDILSLCKELYGKAMVVVDEAYIEFAKAPSLTSYLSNYPNLVILRTLSKAYGLAGIRCGVAIANACVIKLLKKIITPYPIPSPIADIVCQQLKLEKVKEKIETICNEKEKLTLFLEKLPCIKKVWKSQANFLLFEASDPEQVMQICLRNGISLRDRSHEYNLKNCIRVTIGTPSENKLLMETLENG